MFPAFHIGAGMPYKKAGPKVQTYRVRCTKPGLSVPHEYEVSAVSFDAAAAELLSAGYTHILQLP